jgi:hypothetical protein
VAENPLVTVARLLGGVVLMQGRLGHQVLGQLLVANTNEVAIAGASLVVAATTRQRNAVAQVALRTAAPALAVRALMQKEGERIERRLALLAEKEQRLLKLTEAMRRQERAAGPAAHVAAPVAAGAARAGGTPAFVRERIDMKTELARAEARLRLLDQRDAAQHRRKTPRGRESSR